MASVYRDDDYVLCAALDIGTTFSSYAYSFKKSKSNIEGAREWGANLGGVNLKTPTSVLVDKDGRFVSFGYEAREKYQRLEADNAKMYALFENFKLELMRSEVSVLFYSTFNSICLVDHLFQVLDKCI